MARHDPARGRGPAPGPLSLWLPPLPSDWLALTQPEAMALGIDAKRWRSLQHAARVARAVDACLVQSDGIARLEMVAAPLSGPAPWTTGLLLGLGLGHADAIVPGDVHLPSDVSRFFTDTPVADDDRMLELLEPFRPHRFRVVRFILGGGRRSP